MHYTIDCTDDISHVVCMSTLRIINELTSNSFKHADCNNIYIDIATDDNKLTISYKDDGCGFDFEQIGKVKSNNTGYGIRMLVERVNLLVLTITKMRKSLLLIYLWNNNFWGERR